MAQTSGSCSLQTNLRNYIYNVVDKSVSFLFLRKAFSLEAKLCVSNARWGLPK